ncbi:hypothetical protein [Wolbachia endosymbiont of Folsomia candida]|uniref:hypothetical protein n=1 Tax=Wolbachia endosymbiont of Folsomia candida TaxID=169402 RepID=UPI000A539A40|nr:hypothetical protein [Wolbachia endosymbiont of Folsomia candida]APR98839.1 hypothetical protein ASM33_06465 [Wolbachia endosymbiont of Folsomia candida]
MHQYKKLENLEIDSNKDNTANNKPWYKRGVFGSVINWAQLTVISLLKSIRHLIDMAIAKIVSKESNVGNSKDLLVQEREMETVTKTLSPRLPSYKEAIKGGPPTYEETLNDNPPIYEEAIHHMSSALAATEMPSMSSEDHTSQLVETQNSQANSNKGSSSIVGLDTTFKKIRIPRAKLQSTGKVKSSVGRSVARSEMLGYKAGGKSSSVISNSSSVSSASTESLYLPDIESVCSSETENVDLLGKGSKTSGYETEGKATSFVSDFSNMSNVLSHQAVTKMPSMSSKERVSEWLKTQPNLSEQFANLADSFETENVDLRGKGSKMSGYEAEGKTASSVSDSTSMSNVLSHQAATKMPSMSSEESTSKWVGIHNFQANSNKGPSSVADSSETASVISLKVGSVDLWETESIGSCETGSVVSLKAGSVVSLKAGSVVSLKAGSVGSCISGEAEGETASPVSDSTSMSNALSHQAVTEVQSMSSEEHTSQLVETQNSQSNSNEGSSSVADLFETKSTVSSKAGSVASRKARSVLSDSSNYLSCSADSSETESVVSGSSNYLSLSADSSETESVLSLTPEPVEKVWLTARPLRAFVNFVMRPFRATEVVKDSIVRLEEGLIHLDCKPSQERVTTPTPLYVEVTPNTQLRSVAPSAGAERLQKAQAEGIPGQHERSVLQDVRLSRLRDPETAKELIDTPFMRP